MLKKIKDLIHAAKQKSGALFYNKPQTYEVHYNVSLINKSKNQETVTVVLPMPQTTQHQTILQKSGIEKIETEETFKNTYQAPEVLLAPSEEKNFSTSFLIQVPPGKINENQKKYRLADYDKNSKGYTLYIEPRFSVSPDNKTIQNIAQKLIGDEENIYKIISRINEYVIKSLKYGNPIPGLYTAHETLKKDCVDCGGFSAVFTSMCMSVGIPARVVAGFWAGYPKKYVQNNMHAWAQILLPDGSWITADPTTEKLSRENRTRLFGKLGVRSSDRVIFSLGCDVKIAGQRINILQNPTLLKPNPKLSLALTYTAKRVS